MVQLDNKIRPLQATLCFAQRRKLELIMGNIIQIDSLSKSFGEVKAVQNLSFRVKTGELFAFLGINGAGKSTTISIMCGHLRKDAGSVVIDGENIDRGMEKIKRELGAVFQNSVLDKALSVQDNLMSRAAPYGIMGKAFNTRLKELAELLDFGDLLKRPIGNLSGGQRRRIDIARALLHKPKILILDEPTTGLDPQTRKSVWNVVEKLRREENITVFLTTHYMEEAADADYVVILDGGRTAAEGTPLMLKNTYTSDFITLYGITREQAEMLGAPYEALRGAYQVAVPDTKTATALITKYPDIFKDYEITKGRMDDVFLAATGKNLAGGGGR